MNLSKSYEFLQPEKISDRIHIIGCGSVGSTLAENLARFGFTKITLYDFDKVESHNLVNQMFTQKDVGMPKVEAVKRLLIDINPEAKQDIKTQPNGYTDQRLAGYVFLCVDNIELRHRIAQSNEHNPFVKAMFDFRTRLTDAQHYAADWRNEKDVKAFLNSMNFTHEEAAKETPVSACNVRLGVCTTVRMIVAAGVGNFVNFTGGKGLKRMILTDAFAFGIDAM